MPSSGRWWSVRSAGECCCATAAFTSNSQTRDVGERIGDNPQMPFDGVAGR
jgi:hypothetical protein